jgi:alpha-beta hydrolase superfamily lysophospholipase
MRVETHVLNDIHAQRFRQENARYALLISHGIGGHSGIYNAFCEHHAAKSVDVWAYDAPGHGRSTLTRGRGDFLFAEWVDACVAYAGYIREVSGLPVIALGSSLGVAATFCSLHSDAIVGGVLMGAAAVPSAAGGIKPGDPLASPEVQAIISRYGRSLTLDISRMINFDEDYGYKGAGEQKRKDPYNTWTYDLKSWASLFAYEPNIPADRNTKPILYAVGDKDALASVEAVRACAKSIAGPVQFEVLENASHQLMLFSRERFSTLVEAWAAPILAAAHKRP